MEVKAWFKFFKSKLCIDKLMEHWQEVVNKEDYIIAGFTETVDEK